MNAISDRTTAAQVVDVHLSRHGLVRAVAEPGTDAAIYQVVDMVLRDEGAADALAARLIAVVLGADEPPNDVTVVVLRATGRSAA